MGESSEQTVLQAILEVVTKSGEKLDRLENRLIEIEIKTKASELGLEELNKLVWRNDPSITNKLVTLNNRLEAVTDRLTDLEGTLHSDVNQIHQKLDSKSTILWSVVVAILSSTLSVGLTNFFNGAKPHKEIAIIQVDDEKTSNARLEAKNKVFMAILDKPP